MEDILDEDKFYHNKKGLLIYLITRYREKIEHTIKQNFKKAKNINHGITAIGITFILTIFTYIIMLFSKLSILILFL